MKISLSRAHFPVTTLGPGRRLGIWLQGCSIRCPGCISSDTWAHRSPDLDVTELMGQLQPWLSRCDGVTVSGGEPFEQPQALAQLLRSIRASKETNILVYSGRTLEDLRGHRIFSEGLIDCLISDPFDVNAAQTRALRGSDNQRMTLLTPTGAAIFGDQDRATIDSDRKMDVMFDADGAVWLAGIPSRGDIAKLRQMLGDEGTYVTTTEARV